jgi:hypothetical protein
MAEMLEMVRMYGRALLRVMVASRLKVSFDQTAAPVPEIMDGSLYITLQWVNLLCKGQVQGFCLTQSSEDGHKTETCSGY